MPFMAEAHPCTDDRESPESLLIEPDCHQVKVDGKRIGRNAILNLKLA